MSKKQAKLVVSESVSGSGSGTGSGSVKSNKMTKQFVVPAELHREFDEFRTFLASYKLRESGVFLAAIMACMDTLKREIPQGRSFKLNGKTVVV